MKKRRFNFRVIDGDLYCALMVSSYAINNKRRLRGKKPIRRRNIKKTYGVTKTTIYCLMEVATKYYMEEK